MEWISENFGFDDCEVNYQRVSLNQLSADLSQVIIFGVVIAKQDARRITSKKQCGSDRYVLNFTLRDSTSDTINAVCWGEESVIGQLSSSFTIGDVVRIKNPQIMTKQPGEADEKFRPLVTSQYQLNISPTYSEIILCEGEDQKAYENFLHCAVRNSSDLLSLADVVYNSQNADGLSVNLLVAIKNIGKLQTIKTKDGREVKKFSLSVFDQSHSNFPVLIWDEETAKFILKYCSKRTVLLMSDIRVQYNKFMKEMAATATSTTIFTPEPEIADGRVLYQYAMNISMPNDDEDESEKIYATTVYTVEQIIQLMNNTELMNDIQGFTVALISEFDVDGTTKLSSFRCPGCLQLLQKPEDRCVNGGCDVGSGMKNVLPEQMYDLQISLADSTGSISRCLLSGQVAQNLLGATVAEFLSKSDDEKTCLKWKYLFEWFKVQFKISSALNWNGKAILRICQIEKTEA
ncbi:meiosis-specific with OB domain-containing protein-like [Uloborus diversus]|uniref:meiosis-specific with OB domain-containing protein-like n=1 Tax=Uloborus diversus TaxID=327109 RepID=UPI002408F8F1|nr:meiosis-specific with OB domain-containing protein-like [Uloborus diversus]